MSRLKNSISSFIKRHLDIFLPSLLFVFFSTKLFWLPVLLPTIKIDTLVIVIPPVLTAIGILIVNRANEKIRNPKLKLVYWGYYKFRDSVRIFAEVENAMRREIAREARALITIKKIDNGEERPLKKDDLVPHGELKKWSYDDPLVSHESVRVEGEPLPWMIPESPYQSHGLHGIDLEHITNIAPGQRNRVAIAEIICNEKRYIIKVFSEYGTEEKSVSKLIPSTTLQSATVDFIRRIRCALYPGKYRFYLNISADKTYPVIAIMEVNTIEGKIKFIRPPHECLDLKTIITC